MNEPTFAMSVGRHPRQGTDPENRERAVQMILDAAGLRRWDGHGLTKDRPQRGVSVVYVLFDADDVACYFGSTMAFPTRLCDHRKSSYVKGRHRWLAVECASLPVARDLETAALTIHLPYLNRRRAA